MKRRIANKINKRIAEGSVECYSKAQRKVALRFLCREAIANLKRVDRAVTNVFLNQYRAMGFIS